MINGAHAIVSSTNADADRAFFRDVLGLPNVDVGDGWLIFGLPPSEVAVHPAESNDSHELYLMCDDIEAFVRAMQERELECSEIADQGWGLVIKLTLPGGGSLGVYEPRHARPEPPGARAAASKPARRRPAKKPPARPAKAAARTKTAAKPKAAAKKGKAPKAKAPKAKAPAKKKR